MSLKTLIITLSLALGGCASMNMQRPPSTDQPTSEVIQVVIKDDGLDLSPRHVAAGRVSLEVENDGLFEHVLRVEGPGLDEPSETSVASGQHRQVWIRMKPGALRLFCPDADHAARGLQAELTVNEKPVAFHR